MLKFLRSKHIQKRIYWVLAGAIVLPFAFWGVNPSTDDAKIVSSLGVIEGRRIGAKEYLDNYNAVRHQLFFMFGEKASQFANSMNLKGEAWDRVLLLHRAKKEKIRTGDQEVVDWVTQQPAFSDKGRFNPQFYKLFVERYLRTSTRQFEEEVRGTLTIQKLISKLRSKIAVSDEEARALYQKASLEREIAYAVVPWESQKASVKIEDKEIEPLYEILKNQPAEGGKTKTEKELKDELRENFTKQKATDLAVQKLKSLKEKLTPENFESVLEAEKIPVKRFESLTADAYVPGVGPAESLSGILSNVKEGQVSEVAVVPTGAAIVKVLKDKPLDEKKFEAEKEAFRKKAADEKARKEIGNYITKLRADLKLNPEAMKALFSDES